jgi:hypothetical protein
VLTSEKGDDKNTLTNVSSIKHDKKSDFEGSKSEGTSKK